MRLDQMTKRPGAAPARSVTSDGTPRLGDGQPATPARDPLAELARLIAQDETFATIVPNDGRSNERLEVPLRRDERPSAVRAGADVRLAVADIAEGPSDEPHDYDHGDYDEPDYADELPDRRRWLRMSAAILGLALLGSASAFAYWAWFDARGSVGEVRAIAASTAPEKVTPPPQQDDSRWDERLRTQSNAGGGGGTGSGEEKPAEAQSAAPQALPPVGLPNGPAPTEVAALTSGAPSPDSTVAAQSQPPPSNEPAPGPTALAAPEPSVAQGPQYIVQLSSQRSEAAAQATSRGLQTKYAGLFGSLQPSIRRSDLRERGVYYRVVIGPFATIGEANQLCGSLKKSGGDCVVQKN